VDDDGLRPRDGGAGRPRDWLIGWKEIKEGRINLNWGHFRLTWSTFHVKVWLAGQTDGPTDALAKWLPQGVGRGRVQFQSPSVVDWLGWAIH